jgi:LemA protein
MSTGWIVLGVIVVLVFLAFAAYNRLVALGQRVGQAFADIDVQLKQRHDLVPNLVETVKGYARHEKAVFDDIANARAAMMGASSRAEKIQTANQFEGAISKLLSISEAYPQLKADATYQRLMDELAGTENRLAVERKRYNDAVQQYNSDIRRIPGAWWAKIGGFTPKEYFKAESGARAVPKVSFQ